MKFKYYKCGELVDFENAIIRQVRNRFGNTMDWEIYHPKCYTKMKEERKNE